MHELSIAQGLVDLITQEMAKHGVTKLLRLRVKYGQLSQVVPEALETAWEVMTVQTPLAGAVLELEEVPLKVACWQCGLEFSPERAEASLMVCPGCGENFGHRVLSGKELYLDQIEAE